MPELPEVETMRRGIAAIAGCRIEQIQRPRCRLRPIEITPELRTFRRRAIGQSILAVERIGKRVVLVLERGERIVIEPRMTGLVLLTEPPTAEHLRFQLTLTPGTDTSVQVSLPSIELLFWDRRGLGLVRLCSPAEFEVRYGAQKLGPDALVTTPELLRERLGRSRRPIKVALLDQQLIAGIGNLYASEVLHLAQVHPALPCDRLTKKQWGRVQAAVLEVLEAAILHEGSTLADGTYRNALNQNGSYQNQHRVYDRAGQRCGRCNAAEVLRVVQAQRSTFFCPKCQRQ